MKVAVVHDCLVTHGGAEAVLKEILTLFPEADLFSLLDFYENPRSFKKSQTTFIQKLPFSKKLYRYYFPLMPYAIEALDLSSYDLIISSSYLVAKGVITHPDQLHICYCHSPMRYVWDMQSQYLSEMTGPKALFANLLFHKMRLWDVASSSRVDTFAANSLFIQKRIHKCYRRDSQVIYPPVERFPYSDKKEDFYLTCSRLVTYKRVDLIVKAFTKKEQKKLFVIGDGPELKKLMEMATSNITFLGRVDDVTKKEYLKKAKGFIYAALEDFGIAPLEAQSAGTPVIAFGKGGALETILGLDHKKPTGCFFYEQKEEALIHAVALFEKNLSRIHSEACLKNAENFSVEKFRKEFSLFVEKEYQLFHENHTTCRRKRTKTLASI